MSIDMTKEIAARDAALKEREEMLEKEYRELRKERAALALAKVTPKHREFVARIQAVCKEFDASMCSDSTYCDGVYLDGSIRFCSDGAVEVV